MNCSVAYCKEEVEFLCTFCVPEQNFCKFHSKEHVKTMQHLAVSLDLLNELRSENKLICENINQMISKVFQQSKLLIKEIEMITLSTIQELVKLNRNSKRLTDLFIVQIQENEVREIRQIFNRIYQLTSKSNANEFDKKNNEFEDFSKEVERKSLQEENFTIEGERKSLQEENFTIEGERKSLQEEKLTTEGEKKRKDEAQNLNSQNLSEKYLFFISNFYNGKDPTWKNQIREILITNDLKYLFLCIFR